MMNAAASPDAFQPQGIIRPNAVHQPRSPLLLPPSVLPSQCPPPGAPPPSTPPPRGPAPGGPLLSSPTRGTPLISSHSPSTLLRQTVAGVHRSAPSSIAPPREPQPGTPPAGSSLHTSPRFLPRKPPPPPAPTGSPAASGESAQGNPGSPLEGSPLTPLETARFVAAHEITSGTPYDNPSLGGRLPMQSGKTSSSRSPPCGQSIGIPLLGQSSRDNVSIAPNSTSSAADTSVTARHSAALDSTSEKVSRGDKSNHAPTDVARCSEYKAGTQLASKNGARNDTDLIPSGSLTVPSTFGSLPPPSGMDVETWSAALAAALRMQSRPRESGAAVIPFSSVTLDDSNKNVVRHPKVSTSLSRIEDRSEDKPKKTAERLLNDEDDEWQEVKALSSFDAHQDVSTKEQIETKKELRGNGPRSYWASNCQDKDAQVEHKAKCQLSDELNQNQNAVQGDAPKHAYLQVETIGGAVVLRHEDITASRWIQVDVAQGELIVFREQPTHRARELNRIPVRGALIDFETAFLDVAVLKDASVQAEIVRPASTQSENMYSADESKLPNKLAAFRITTVVAPRKTWLMQPLISALSVRWVGILIDIATGGDATAFSRSCNSEKVGVPAKPMSVVSGSKNFRDRRYSYLPSRFPSSERNAGASDLPKVTRVPVVAATSKIECSCNHQDCDWSSIPEVELIANAALRSRRLRKVALDACGGRRAAERLVFRVFRASRPACSHEMCALVAKVVAAVHAPEIPVDQTPTIVRTNARRSRVPLYRNHRAISKKLAGVIAPNRSPATSAPSMWTWGNLCSDDDFRYIRWLKTHCPTIQSTNSLCECLRDGVAIASVLEDALGYTLPIDRSPTTRQAEHDNWKICLTVIRRSGRVDGLFVSTERVMGSLSADDSAEARSICRSIFTAYESKRLRISAIRLVQWYDSILRIYDFGLGHFVGSDYVLPESDAWTIPIAAAFADGSRLDVIFRHFFGDDDVSSFEPQRFQNVSDNDDVVSRRLGGALTRAAGAYIPCFFSCGRAFKSALEASSIAVNKTEEERRSSHQDRDFALLQFHFFWLGLKDRVPTKPRAALQRDSVLQ